MASIIQQERRTQKVWHTNKVSLLKLFWGVMTSLLLNNFLPFHSICVTLANWPIVFKKKKVFNLKAKFLIKTARDFPGSPVVKDHMSKKKDHTFTTRGEGSVPGWGTCMPCNMAKVLT